MTDEPKIQIGHYATHAREFLLDFSKQLEQKLGIPPTLELFLVDYLQSSVKFVLPENGFLFADHDYQPKMFELQKLPFDACTLEFVASKLLYTPASGLYRADKRMALCFDPNKLPPGQKARLQELYGPHFLESLPERALAVMAVFEAEGLWGASCGLILLDLDEDKPIHADSKEAEELGRVATSVIERLGARTTKYGLPVKLWVFRERAAIAVLSASQAEENLYIDTADEVRATYEFLAAINCANVSTFVKPEPKPLNARRIKKGKTLFYEYHFLSISALASEATGAPGSHASPRTHLRRGHLRRLSEKTIWINAAVVNPGKN